MSKRKGYSVKVCLINFPFTKDKFEGREYGKFEQYEQNYELACIASYLEYNGIESDIIECVPRKIDIPGLIQYVQSNEYDVLVLAVEEYTFLNTIRFLNKIYKSKYLIFTGKYSIINYEKILKKYPEKSICIMANPEAASLGIIQYISGKKKLSSLKDIAYNDGNVIKSEISSGIPFNLLPLPKRTFISPNGMAGIESTRGCNNNCIYCTANVSRRSIQYKEIKNLMIEMTSLIENNGVKYFRFHDENFLISSRENRNRLEEFCKEIEKRNWNIQFKVFARAVDIIKNKDLLLRLKSVGLDSVFVGVESFVQRQLDFYRKNTTVQQNKEALKIIKENNINYTIGFLPIDPFVSLEELEINYNAIREIGYSQVDSYMNLPMSCIPPLAVLQGSDFQKIVDKENLRINNELGYRLVKKGVAEFYNLKEFWRSKIMPVHDMNYIVGLADQRNETELVSKLKQAKMELMELDLDVLLDIIRMLKLYNDTYDNIKIDNKYFEKLKKIRRIFIDAKSILLPYS